MTDELRSSAARLRATAESLTAAQMAEPSRLPGWTRAHVLTHVARAADSRRRLLDAARRGEVGVQYPSEEARAAQIEEEATGRAAAEVVRDLGLSLDRLLDAVETFPDELRDAPGEWLGPGRRPVGRAAPSMVREIEYHHVDLDAGYGPSDWPEPFVKEQLAALAKRDDMPPGSVWPQADPEDILAWLTGRGAEHLSDLSRPPLS